MWILLSFLLGVVTISAVLWYIGKSVKPSIQPTVPAPTPVPPPQTLTMPFVPLRKSHSALYLDLGVGFMYIPEAEVLVAMMAGKMKGLKTMFIKNGKMIDHIDSGLNLPVWLEDLCEVYGLDVARKVGEAQNMQEVVVDGRHLWLPRMEEGIEDAELQRRPGPEDGGFWFNC